MRTRYKSEDGHTNTFYIGNPSVLFLCKIIFSIYDRYHHLFICYQQLFICLEDNTFRRMRKKQRIETARESFIKKYPDAALIYNFAGTDCTQVYLQMHKDMRSPLCSGTKTVTRRTWKDVERRTHYTAYLNNSLVAVLGQGHDTTLGYVLYTGFEESSVGTKLSKDDLRKEGFAGWTDQQFRERWYTLKSKRMLPDDTKVYVISFNFFAI